MEDALREAGLSRNESKVYLKLSEFGLSSAYKVAKEAKLYKSNTYDALRKLEERGLVSRKVIGKKVRYEALDPSLLLNLMESKREKVSKIIPQIKLLQQCVVSESQVNIYKGMDALRGLFYHFLDFKQPLFAYGVPEQAFEAVRFWIDKFHLERIKRGIKMYHIYNFGATERVRKLNKMRLTPVRCLPQLFDSQVATNVCGDEVVLVIFRPSLKMIQVKDQDLAESYKRYFRILWDNAGKIA